MTFSSKQIKITAERIYKSCQDLFEERLQSDERRETLQQQLDQYYDMKPKDTTYLNNLQFLYETWYKTIPKPKEQGKRDVVYFYNPKLLPIDRK